MAIKLTKGEHIFKVVNYFVLAVLSLIAVYPFYYTIISSFSDPVTGNTAYLWVKDFYTTNYWLVFNTPGIGQAYLITVLRVVVAVPAMLLVTSAAAFAMTRRELKGRNVIMGYFFITMFFSGGLIPFFLVLDALGLINTFWVYILPALFNIWTMIVMRTSIQALPEGMVESARIDGAGYVTIYLRIILPLSGAMMAAMALFSMVGHWNEWFTGAFFVTNPKLQPLQTFLRLRVLLASNSTLVSTANNYPEQFIGNSDPADLQKLTARSLENAYIIIATLPILIVYPFLQKYFVKGVLIGSIKG